MQKADDTKGFWSGPTGFVVGLGGFVTAIAGLIAALAAAGWISASDDKPPVTDPPAVATPQGDRPEPTPTEQPLSDVTLLYAGDAFGCVLSLTFDIGSRSVTPDSTSFVVRDLPSGASSYRASGLIDCGFNGTCEAQGGGPITIADGSVFNIAWQNTGVGVCTVALA